MKSITCKEAVESILKKEEGRLGIMGQIRLWRHLAICRLCKTFSIQNKLINKFIASKEVSFHRLSDDEKEVIIRNVLDKENR